jgi:CAI-1 autoinducer synthase
MALLPDWFDEVKEPALTRLARFETFPFDQPSDTKGYLTCHHNDYLRLSSHPEVISAMNEANEKTGSGARSAIMFSGEYNYHNDFRAKVAEVAQLPSAECVLLTTSGWNVNVGVMETLAKPGMPVYIDINAHAYLWDGARLSPGKLIPVRHNRPDLMQKYIRRYGQGIIVIDAYYSTHGSVAPLKDYVELAEATNCLLVLDESHSFGMIGNNGGGLAVDRGVADRIPIRTVSLAKALGGNGGLVMGDENTIYWLMYRMRSIIFSSIPSPASSAGNLAALNISLREPDRAIRTQKNAAYLRKLLNENGVDTGPSACQIVSLFFQGEEPAATLFGELKKKSILFSVFVAPAVPRDCSLARFSIYTHLTKKDIEYIAETTINILTDKGLKSEFSKK